MATLPQGLYGLRPPNPVTMALVGEPPLVAGDPVAALRAYAATLPPGVAAGPVKTAASGPDWGKIGDYLLTKSWPSRMVQAAWGAATLPGDVYAGRVDPNSDEGIARANDLAGLVTLGAGAVPAEAGALRAGVGIKRAPSSLPMDEASRMARAKEMGFDTGKTQYHSTTRDINEFVPSQYRGATFMADDASAAERAAAAGGMEHPALSGPSGDAPAAAGPSIYPLVVKGKIFGRDSLPEEWFPKKINYGAWRKEIDGGWKDWTPPNSESWTPSEISTARFLRRQALGKYTEAVPESEYYKYAGKNEALMPLKPGSLVADTFGYKSFEGPDSGKDFRELLKKIGYSGAMVIDEAGRSVAMFEPSNIRSKWAAFDPAKAHLPDILAAGGPGGIVPGAATMLQPGQAEAAPMQNGLFGLRQ